MNTALKAIASLQSFDHENKNLKKTTFLNRFQTGALKTLFKSPVTLGYDYEVKNTFLDMEDDGNGKVSAKELSSYYESYLDTYLAVGEAQFMINSVDLDLDGQMDLDEYNSYAYFEVKWSVEDEIEFVRADANGDSKLSIAEATAAWNRVNTDEQLTSSELWNYGGECDRNDDRKLVRAEILECLHYLNAENY